MHLHSIWPFINTLILAILLFLLLFSSRGNIARSSLRQIIQQLFTKKQPEFDRKTALDIIGTQFNSTADFNEMITAMLRIAKKLVSAEGGILFLYNKQNNSLEVAASDKEVTPGSDKTIRMDKKNILWRVFSQGEPLCIDDVTKNSQFTIGPVHSDYGRSVLCVPVKSRHAALGVLTLNNYKNSPPFTEENLSSLLSITGHMAVVVENELYRKSLIKKMKEMETLFRLSEQVLTTLDLKEALARIANLANEITRTDACSIRLLDSETNELVIMYARGVSPDYKKKGNLKIGEGVGGRVVKDGVPITIENLATDTRIQYTSYLKQEGLVSLASVPIRDGNSKVIGIISVYNKTITNFNEETVNLLCAFANHVAGAIHNAALFDNIKKNYYGTIHALVLALEARDTYTSGHSARVADYAVQVAKKMGLSDEEIDILYQTCRLHDIGKIAISDNILKKKNALSISEYTSIKTHPERGADLLTPLKFLEKSIPGIKHHHERWDGEGYPDRLSKTQIPLMARIIAVADAFDAMTSVRPYRDAMDNDAAISCLRENAHTQFDEEIVGIFTDIAAGTGTTSRHR